MAGSPELPKFLPIRPSSGRPCTRLNSPAEASRAPGSTRPWGPVADMHNSTVYEKTSASPAESGPGLGHLREVIEHAGHLLPAQGPITVFIHHNTLHAFEDFPFNEAVKKAASVFGCQPFLSEDRYHQELTRGRIRFSELS